MRQRIVGYIIVAALVVGLAFLVYWIIAAQPGKRFRGIEKLRGESAVPMPEQTGDSRQMARISHEETG